MPREGGTVILEPPIGLTSGWDSVFVTFGVWPPEEMGTSGNTGGEEVGKFSGATNRIRLMKGRPRGGSWIPLRDTIIGITDGDIPLEA